MCNSGPIQTKPWFTRMGSGSTLLVCYHGLRNDYVNSVQEANSCNCNCNLAASIILNAIIYVIVLDAFAPRETEAHAKSFLLTIYYELVIVSWEEHSQDYLYVCNWVEPKQPMKLQQPRNYDFGMFQFNRLGSQGGSSREMTTSPPGHH